MPLFVNYRSKIDYPAPPHHPRLQTHHTRRATVSTALPFTPHAESTHGGHSWRLAYLLLFTRGHGGEVYRRAANRPKKTNSIPQPPPFLPSFRRRRFIPQTPICQTKRQSVLWKYHTSFYVINNPLVNSPTRGSFRAAPNRTRKTHAATPKETLQGNLFDNPLGHAARACPRIAE